MSTSTSPPPQMEPPDYEQDIDFKQLAHDDEDFAKVYHDTHGKIDFQDPKVLQQLTKSLLKRDFGLSIELPDERLCPPVPVRYNYVRWIQALLDTTSPDFSFDSYDSDRKVIGLDIGTGASAIYSLLATSLRPRWTMHGTEIDSKSFAYARRNIALNNLTSRIHAHLSPSPEAPLIPFEKLSEGAEDSRRLDFTMCNPPFYSSVEDLATSKTFKSQKPTAICTGADIEMICEGGDIGFVLHMLDESLILRDKIQWYTSMLGKLSSAYTLVTRLKEGGISNWAVSSLRKNGKTKRWVVGWSFGDRRPRWDVCCDGDIPAALLPQTTVMSVRTSPLMGKEVEDTLNASLDALDLDWTWNGETRTGVGSARGNVWSRSARRKRKRDEVEHSPTDKPTNSENRKVDSDTVQSGSDKKMVDTSKEKGEEIALAFKISFSSGSTSSVMALPETSAPTGTKVTNDDSVTNNETVEAGDMQIRWLQGHDWGLFESFSGMLRRAITVQVNLRTQETDKAKSGS